MKRQVYDIIATPLVERLRQDGFALPESTIRYYPDGSIWTADYCISNHLREILKWETGGYGSFGFRSIAAFGDNLYTCRQYVITYPGWYAWFLSEYDESGVVGGPGAAGVFARDEYDLAHLHILVKLHRKMKKENVEGLADVVRQWFTDIGSKGVFGEGGVTSISPAMRYRGREASFILDARGSGQETLNTLYLAILNWGMARRVPLHLIDLAGKWNEKAFTSAFSVPLG